MAHVEIEILATVERLRDGNFLADEASATVTLTEF